MHYNYFHKKVFFLTMYMLNYSCPAPFLIYISRPHDRVLKYTAILNETVVSKTEYYNLPQ